MTSDNSRYEFVCASDLQRDGMGLECYEGGADGERELVLEAFWCDANGSFTFTAFRETLPFDLVEDFVRRARVGLPPAR
jgi:hypothetical protein